MLVPAPVARSSLRRVTPLVVAPTLRPVHVSTLTTLGQGTLLPELRALLSTADRALLCTAFVSDAGVHLIRDQLAGLGPRARLLTTTVFGSTSPSALNAAQRAGVDVRVLNPSTGSYHPKLYLAGRGADDATMLIGSANLTGGLVNNVETAALVRGCLRDEPIADAWRIGEALWSDPRAVAWTPVLAAEPERFTPELERQIRAEVERDPVFLTLGPTPKKNEVTAVSASGVYVTSDATRAKGTTAQLVPAWMIQLAYDYLVEHGQLTNAYLLSSDGLNVKRSSFVCALLARLPGVVPSPRTPVELRYQPARPYVFAQPHVGLLAADRARATGAAPAPRDPTTGE